MLIPGRTVVETLLTLFLTSPPPEVSPIILVRLAAPRCCTSCLPRAVDKGNGWAVDERRRERCTLARGESAPVHKGDEGSQAKTVEVDRRRRARSRGPLGINSDQQRRMRSRVTRRGWCGWKWLPGESLL